MNSFDIRKKFLEYFKKNGHEIVPSSSLIPAEDPTLLFTNAGMNQFKDLFLGKEKRSYKKATSIQKCVRAGGKHNDLDEVGFTNRHLTFFEMMGNFSFGDYFKKEAIEYAWEFLTKEIKISKDEMVVSVYKDDDQAYDLWNKNIGIPKEKIFKLGEKDNFWQMGDTGPCGPCTEIHIDHGKDVGCKKSTCAPDCSCGRFTEIWNLVFMQFNRQENGELIPLKQTGVDTGMGFERLCMILQNKNSVFQTDVFEPLIKKIEEISKIKYEKSNDQIKAAFHVLCDHARSCSLLIADGCVPSNDGRGYVLRKIIRRAALFAQKLSDKQKLFSTVANEFIAFYSPIYSELKTNHNLIIELLDNEIQKFSDNLLSGKNILEKYIQETLNKKQKVLDGKHIFKLYDTYGFPAEITKVIAQERGISLDLAGFEKEMEKQKAQSGKKSDQEKINLEIPEKIHTKFLGYENLETTSEIIFTQKDGDYLWVVTKESPFYVESGGQVSDKGFVSINNDTYEVEQLFKADQKENPAIAFKISFETLGKNLAPQDERGEKNKRTVRGEEADRPSRTITVGDKAHCVVDLYKRKNSQKNHTATHLLQTALSQVLGEHIKQAGSFVCDEYLRFDFTHNQALTNEEIKKVENIVNNVIQEDIKLEIFNTTLKDAQAKGVTAFFGEKYSPENVRVVKVHDFSAELCGGTHVKSTGEIGCFKIEIQEALTSGTRRITALTGPKAVELFQLSFDLVKNVCKQFSVKPQDAINAFEKQIEEQQELKREIKKLKKDFLKNQVPTWQNQVELVGKIPFLFLELEDTDISQLKPLSQDIEKKSPGFYFMIIKTSEKPEILNFFGYLSKKWEKEINLKEFIEFIKNEFEFKGGGNSTLIQGSGKKVDIKNLANQINIWLAKQ